DGEGRRLAVKAVGVSAFDEIGDVARAFDQVQGEVLRLADNEAGLRGKLSEMFTELSGRGQSLMEHQLRLIDELGQTEPDAGRRASLATLNHLVAELTENAASLSAADTPVDISGRTLVTGGVLVEVTDQGVGMNPEMMAQANWRLENPPPVDVAVSRNMGLFVVGRLAIRHGVKVRLQSATTGGLTALVWLPDALGMLPGAGAVADLGPAAPDAR